MLFGNVQILLNPILIKEPQLMSADFFLLTDGKEEKHTYNT